MWAKNTKFGPSSHFHARGGPTPILGADRWDRRVSLALASSARTPGHRLAGPTRRSPPRSLLPPFLWSAGPARQAVFNNLAERGGRTARTPL
jgi:hypothetical protein